ncbi:ATP-grasp domain-containing protein [Streptococcus ovuberis]|uniref:Carbamoyl phosphate synthase large subunit n=1 Tax=Streptococcus ovuberis TaxID=1936207 RepID=A0A7X6MZ53_9STRE|nr:carbamoyl phosphate synthase large subunit [Streptococcus ovuberis]NKZ20128.1 carbamoyl phosphate synthase large subunit [Streptococcus ovuberis]
MNYLVLSPYYPENFQQFSIELAKKGITVLAIGQEPYEQLGADLQAALTEYFRVEDLENLDEVKRAAAFLFYKHGPFDRIESQNEHWLEHDAALREQFNVFGMGYKHLKKTKFKSKMKKYFKKAGIPVVPGKVAEELKDVEKIVKKIGLPLIAKPDSGVGASGVFKLTDEASVEAFKEAWDGETPYFLEAFVDKAVVCTYDGLVDRDGNIIYETSLTYNNTPFDMVQHQLDMGYYAEKEIDPVLRDYGRAAVKAFGMKERFFHIEFFRYEDGSYVAIEYNNRAAGGYTVDVYNHGHRINLFHDYAAMIAGETFPERDFSQYSFVVSRRHQTSYRYSDEEIKAKYGQYLIDQKDLKGAFSELLGDVNYFFVFDETELIDEIYSFVTENQ